MPRSRIVLLGALASLVQPTLAAVAPRSPTPSSEADVFLVSTVVEGIEHGWGLELLPDGRMLVTERPGRMRIIDRQGRLSEPLGGLPQVAVGGEDGLLDTE